MRLLHFDHSGRLVLTNFRQKIIPPYAILSHRWGDSEILLEDIGNGTYKDKGSYRKLEFCAKQAARDKLQYFWIDTCCIDKWNLEELSYAINSMFHWYKNATRCYVFLSDVSVSTATETPQRSDWEASFRASEWFTRGWTLQELIAPVSVEFFSCDGRRLGDKTTLEQLVHQVTSIPLAALQSYPLDDFTISERMDWAENRITTEEEDNAYCLLGILGISMPPHYGEGRRQAFSRLQMEVEAANNAPSIIPFPQNDRFVGRESQLAELEAKLFDDKQTTTLAIVGPRGTGKSQLALELACRTRQRYRDYSVFWIDASDVESLYQSYASIAQKLKIPGWDDQKTDLKQLVKLHLEEKIAKQCLLIFDNAEDRNLESSGLSTTRGADVLNYLPQSELCTIILTTTNSDIPKRLALQDVVELKGLTPDMAQRMLKKHVNNPISGSEQAEAELLLQELLYLPLAIVQAAAYINTRNMTLQEYRSQLGGQKKPALEDSSEFLKANLQGYGTNDPVATTLFISVDQIRRNNALAAGYLFLATCVDRKDIPLVLLEASSHPQREDAVRLLSSYALVTRRPADSAFDLHRLVHAALRGWLQNQELRGQWIHHAITRLLSVFPGNDHGSRSKWRRLLPHAMSALSYGHAERESEEKSTLTHKCAITLHSEGRYNEAKELFVQFVETSKRVLGEEHPDMLTSMSNLASTYSSQGQWKEAEVLEVQVMETRKRVLGEKHPDTLTSMNNLALTYSSQGRWKEAEVLGVQVIETRKIVLGKEHSDTLTSIVNLASTYKDQGRWEEAEVLEVQVMEIRKTTLSDEHPDTLISMDNLASTYYNQGRYEEAEKLHAQVLDTRKMVLGDKHPNVIISIANVASTHYNQGRYEEAERLFVQAVEISKEVLGEEHPKTLTGVANLASTYLILGRWQEAEEQFAHVKETSERVLGEEHPATLLASSNLAVAIKILGRKEEAILLMETCIQLRDRALGSPHPITESLLKILNEWRTEDLQISQ